MPCKSYPLRSRPNPKKEDFARGEKFLANNWEGVRQNGFNTLSSIHDYKEAEIEAQ